jgi:hypothetical protein
MVHSHRRNHVAKRCILLKGVIVFPNVGDIRLNLLETHISSAYGAPDRIQWAPTGLQVRLAPVVVGHAL